MLPVRDGLINEQESHQNSRCRHVVRQKLTDINVFGRESFHKGSASGRTMPQRQRPGKVNSVIITAFGLAATAGDHLAGSIQQV